MQLALADDAARWRGRVQYGRLEGGVAHQMRRCEAGHGCALPGLESTKASLYSFSSHFTALSLVRFARAFVVVQRVHPVHRLG